MTQIELKEYNLTTLKRIDEWTTNCDLKTSIFLAFSTVIITSVIANEYVLKSIERIVIDTFNFWEYKIGSFCFVSLLEILFLLAAYVFFGIGLYHFYRVLKAKTNSNSITNSVGLVQNSKIFFRYIQSIDYNQYSNDVKATSIDELNEDYLSQIYICSKRCDEKFRHYNIALKMISLGLIFFALFVVLMILKNSVA